MKAIIITIFIAFFSVIQLSAQEARPAALGIYIDLGKSIPKSISYAISRKAADSSSWEQIANLHFDQDSAMFYANLAQAGRKYPTFKMPETRFNKNIWNLVLSSDITDSIFYYGNTPAFKEALNTAYYDATAKKGVSYTYKITTFSYDGKITLGEKVLTSSYPKLPSTDYQLVTQTISPFNKSHVLKYYSNGIQQPAGIVLMRQVYMQTAFEPIAAYTGITTKADSIIYMAVDTLLAPGLTYRYVALPFDDLGNMGLPSDTVKIANTTFNNTAMVMSVKTTSMEAENAIKLNWKLDNTANVRTVNIYRSTSYEGAGYELIGTVAAHTTEFLDRKVNPVKTYYYSLQPATIYGPGVLSVRFSGMLKANKKAVAPRGLQAELADGKVRLAWHRPDFYTRGYYVYRSGSGQDSLKQVSELIVTDSTEIVYIDHTALAQNSLSYTYAVKAVNTSYAISSYSELVNIAAPGTVKLTTPVNVNARVIDSSVVVFWDNKSDKNVLGYNLFKRIKTDGAMPANKFELLNKEPLSAGRNYFKDAEIAEGVTYEYAVQSLSVNKQESALSAPVASGFKSKRLLPATGLQVTTKGGSVFLSWDNSTQSGLLNYKIYRLKGSESTLLATIDKATHFYEDSAAARTELNTYVITSVSKMGESAPGVAVSIRMK